MARSKPPRQSFAKDSRTNAQTSATLVSAFHPTLPLFASALLSLDAWHIRIADPKTSATRNEYALSKGSTCRCLAWGSVAQNKKSEKSKKKRKVDEDDDVAAASSTGILAAGTNDGTIFLYNPSEDEPIATLSGSHTGEVLAMTMTGSSLWSSGSDGKAVQWDLSTSKVIQSITVDGSQSLKSIAISSSNILAASFTIHQYSLPQPELQQRYTNHTSPVHTILFGPSDHFVSAAEDDRYMNVFLLGNAVQEKALIAEADVKKLALGSASETLCALTVDGTVELFTGVFAATSATSNKRRKSQVTKSSSTVRVLRPDGATVELADVSLRSDASIILAWSEGARIVFETLKILDDQGNLIDSTELVRAKLPPMGALNGTKAKTSQTYQDNNAHIVAGTDTRDIEMTDIPTTNGHVSMVADSDDEEAEATEEPTLAERLHAMEVNAATPAKTTTTTTTSAKAVLKMPSANSLATVLTQALKSNDTALLESCLHHSDSKIILTTIRRLDATFAVPLLEHLASRISRRPGRSSDLGIWVRWTIVVHGGYLASLPNLIRVLSSLHNVLATRAASLPRLLALQGRLDMVNAQIELRRDGGASSNLVEDPSDVEYIEGQSDLSDEEEIGIEDASQLGGGLDTSDESDDDEEGGESAPESQDLDDGEFSEDSGDGNEFADLDAQMEMMQDDDDDDDDEEGEEDEGQSDDEA